MNRRLCIHAAKPDFPLKYKTKGIMKKLIIISAAFLAGFTSSAQYYHKDAVNADMVHSTLRIANQREEFVLPDVNGYSIYKADLHTHSIYSDGDCTPEFRIHEAWYDGLDVIAITEHIEYRRHEGKMLAFLKGYHPEDTEAFNNNIIRKASDGRGIQADLNLAVRLAEEAAKGYGITVIPGTEITREPKTTGHYNALFTKDNNTIYDSDPEKAIRNAKAQDALIMHNHPGWRRTDLVPTEFEKEVYSEGLIDGVEVMNGAEFYPKAIRRALDSGMFVASNTDIHQSSAETYRLNGHRRNMTLIFAKDKSLESLREALEAGRTLAYSFGAIAGDRQLMTDLFKASVPVKTLYTDAKGTRNLSLTNNSSVQYILRNGNGNPFILEPFHTATVKVAKNAQLVLTVENMWVSDTEKLVIEL